VRHHIKENLFLLSVALVAVAVVYRTGMLVEASIAFLGAVALLYLAVSLFATEARLARRQRRQSRQFAKAGRRPRPTK